jgi:hypothetical protein
MALADPWSILGLPRGADCSALRAAYRRAAWQHHPDHGGAASRMAAVNAAYAELTARSRRTGPNPTDHGQEPSSARPSSGPARAAASPPASPAGAPPGRGPGRGSVLWSSRLGQWAATLAALAALDVLWHVGGVEVLALVAGALALIVIADRRPAGAPYWPAGDALAVLVGLAAWLIARGRVPRRRSGTRVAGASFSRRA